MLTMIRLIRSRMLVVATATNTGKVAVPPIETAIYTDRPLRRPPSIDTVILNGVSRSLIARDAAPPIVLPPPSAFRRCFRFPNLNLRVATAKAAIGQPQEPPENSTRALAPGSYSSRPTPTFHSPKTPAP